MGRALSSSSSPNSIAAVATTLAQRYRALLDLRAEVASAEQDHCSRQTMPVTSVRPAGEANVDIPL